jgi:protein-export membrane protein SecD
LGLDLQGGTHLIYKADLSNVDKSDYRSAMEGLKDRIERRINSRQFAGAFGVLEPVVQIQNTGDQWRLVVELAGVKDSKDAIDFIGKTPFLEFMEKRDEEETKKILDKQEQLKNKSLEEIQKIEGWELIFKDPYFKPTPLTGKYLEAGGTRLDFDPTTGKPVILLQFNSEGAKIFEELTAKNIGKPLAIYIDRELISAPIVQGKITGGKAQITGDFTVQKAKEIVNGLRDGALPVPIELISQQSIGPTLGEISLKQSLKAGIYGLIGVIIFMILFFRVPGLIASFALVLYIILMLTLFKLIPVTLTLAGIGGFILSIGMAVDANVLIFSRFREELKEGKNFGVALEEGFRRSWLAIRDGNLTTVFVSLILFFFGTSFIKGFSFTLIIGIFVSIFSAVFVTRSFLRIFVGTKISNYKILW